MASFSPYQMQNSTFAGNDVAGYSRDMNMVTQSPIQLGAAFPAPMNGVGQGFQAATHASSVASTQSDTSSPMPIQHEFNLSGFQQGPPSTFSPGVRPSPYPQAQVAKPQWPSFPAQNPYPPEIPSNQPTFPQTGDQNVASTPMGMPSYPFGQLPNHFNQQNGYRINYHHPLPGSFNRRAFNPQTQPFVPGHRQPMGQPHPCNPQIPPAGGFQHQYQQPSSIPSAFDMPPHGPPHNNMVPHLPTAHMTPPGNSRFPPSAQGPPGTVPAHHLQLDHRTPSNDVPRWNYPASLPPKPLNVVPPMPLPNPGYPMLPRPGNEGPPPPPPPAVAMGSHLPTTVGSMPAGSISARPPR